MRELKNAVDWYMEKIMERTPSSSNTSAPASSSSAATTVAAPLDLHSPNLMQDPYPVYRKLLMEPTITRSTLGFWVAAHHEHASVVLRDKRFGHNYEQDLIARHGPQVFKQPAPRAIRHWVILQNPPNHTRVRSLFASAFSLRRIKEMAPRIENITNRLIDAVADRGQMDIVADLAYPLPSIVIAEILGVPVEDQAQFVTRIPARVLDMAPLSPEESAKINTDVEFITTYFERLCDERRSRPRDDLITALVQGQNEDGALSNEELVANIFLLFAAGHDTTANFLGNALLALYRHPDQLAKLKSDRDLIPTAVDELMRYDSSVQMTIRYALTDAELFGASIKKGNPVMVLIGAANRDPKIYPNPDELDVTRTGLRVLSFGVGMHYCLGAELARLESAIAFDTLFRRLPNLQLDTNDIAWRKTLTVRGLRRLPARW
ncbi:MAG: cytochrome P450 [Sulfurifustaceae bacterium]